MRDGLQAEAASVVAANFNGESVVEAEGRAHGQVEALGIFCFDLVVDVFAIAVGLFFQDRGQCGAGVFGINIDAAGENGLLADEGAGKIEAALDRKVGLVSICWAMISPRMSCSVNSWSR